MADQSNTMLGIVADGEQVSSHFGRSPGFYKCEIANGAVVNKTYVDLAGQAHEQIALALAEQGVQTVIAGGIGQGAVQRLDAMGIDVLAGVGGKAEDALTAFLAGSLDTIGATCNHHHEENHECSHHHDDGHTCNHHHGGEHECHCHN